MPRTSEEMLSKVQVIQSTKYSSKKKQADAMRDAGVGKTRCVLEYQPGAKIDECVSSDRTPNLSTAAAAAAAAC